VSDVAYFAAWEADETVERPTGDSIEAARRASAVKDLRQEREEQARRDELEELAEQRLATAPDLAEVLEKAARQMRANDYSTAKADAKELEKLVAHGGVDQNTDLTDLKVKAGEKARSELRAKKERNEAYKERLRAEGKYIPDPVKPFKAANHLRKPQPFAREAPKFIAPTLEPPK